MLEGTKMARQDLEKWVHEVKGMAGQKGPLALDPSGRPVVMPPQEIVEDIL